MQGQIWHSSLQARLGRQQFFFEKKNQKTFAPLRAALKPPGTKTLKVFLLLFVHKKKFFLPRLSLKTAWIAAFAAMTALGIAFPVLQCNRNRFSMGGKQEHSQ